MSFGIPVPIFSHSIDDWTGGVKRRARGVGRQAGKNHRRLYRRSLDLEILDLHVDVDLAEGT